MVLPTATPWQLGDNELGIFGPDPDAWGILSLYLYEQRAVNTGQGISDETQRANARLIVRAVNTHAELVRACEAALALCVGNGYGRDHIQNMLRDVLTKAKE